ncbi:MAG: hypothetical protein JNL21_22665 [Myxococcales bacterium]|nr:hypothetical protein [Myxococcales bacterium]
MNVLVDTNIWLKERLLRSHLGAAFVFALRQAGARLIYPQSLHEEIEARLAKDVQKTLSELEAHRRFLLTVTGELSGFVMPKVDAAAALRRRVAELAPIMHQVHHSAAELERALVRVTQHVAPAHRTEEFRDALLWEVALRVAGGPSLLLVTADAAFYVEGKSDGVLHQDLRADASACGVNVRAVRSIEDAPKLLGRSASFPAKRLEEALIAGFAPRIVDAVANWSVAPPNDWIVHVDAFLTEQLGRLALSFDMRGPTSLVTLAPSTELVAAEPFATGTATYDSDSGSLSDIQPELIGLRSPEGEKLRAHAFAYVRGTSKTERFTLRHPLSLDRSV